MAETALRQVYAEPIASCSPVVVCEHASAELDEGLHGTGGRARRRRAPTFLREVDAINYRCRQRVFEAGRRAAHPAVAHVR